MSSRKIKVPWISGCSTNFFQVIFHVEVSIMSWRNEKKEFYSVKEINFTNIP